MLAEKERKQQSSKFAFPSKYGEKYPIDSRRTEPRLNSLQILQRSLGNQYLQALSLTAGQPDGLLIQRACACGVRGSCASCGRQEDDRRMLQPKRVVGAPNDKYEQEAEWMADQVMRMPEPKLRRQVNEDEEEEELLQPKPLAQRRVAGNSGGSEAPLMVYKCLCKNICILCVKYEMIS